MAWPEDWGRKVVVTVEDTMFSSGTLAFFPVLLTKDTLPAEILDADGSSPAQADGGDIRVYTGDYSASNPVTENTDRLPLEIVDFTRNNNPALGTTEIWVRVPSISASVDTKITIFYNATGKSQPAVDAAFGRNAVWDDNGSDYNKGCISRDGK